MLVQWAVVDVDADAPENASVDPQLEEGEFIEVFLAPFQGLHKTLVVSWRFSCHQSSNDTCVRVHTQDIKMLL